MTAGQLALADDAERARDLRRMKGRATALLLLAAAVFIAVRITWGGVYVHSAPWSLGSQGYANVSHGCINLSPNNALWYFNQVGIGDPVVINW